MLLRFTKRATVKIIPGQLQAQSGFLLNGLMFYCGRDQDEDNVVGSSPPEGWSSADTFWFDRVTLNLVIVSMGISAIYPEPEDLEKLSVWQEIPYQEGILQLEQKQNFEAPVANFRWMDEEGKALLCPTTRAFEPAQERVRLRIAPDVELWFADGDYCGWTLLNPAYYLVEEPGDELTFDADPVDPQIIALLSDYFLLVTKWNSVLMDDDDPELRARLLDLYERTRAVQGQELRRRVLLLAIADILDRFYNLQLSE